MSDYEKIKPETSGHALALGRHMINRDPILLLELLYANIGWAGSVGACIKMDEHLKREMLECIKFHRGEN